MQSRFEQARISQLISPYSPDDPPRLALDFGDLLSLLWRLDRSAGQTNRERYYRQCVRALLSALGLSAHPVARLIDGCAPGEVCRQLTNLPYRTGKHAVDAQDLKAAIAQLMTLRDDTLRIGTYQEAWTSAFPGSGIVDTELRERVFAVMFTALQGQFANFGRLLLVVDIVLANLIVGFDNAPEIDLPKLVADHGYPDPADPRVHKEYATPSKE
ncbi:MAG: hypothetical protein IAE80_13955 [Anaerolinea sp.]|nr:hypothetical protein [Anaerolinea sp.]